MGRSGASVQLDERKALLVVFVQLARRASCVYVRCFAYARLEASVRACSGILAAKGIVKGAAMRIGFIGFGNMASAMADGWIAAGVDAGRMSACAGHFDALRERCEARGMTACSGAAEVVAASDLLIVAVKPHLIAEVVGPLAEELSGKAVLSVAWSWD